MMCCLTRLLGYLLQSFSVVTAAIAFLVITAYFLKMLWQMIFPKQRKYPDGYKEQWYGREPAPLANDVVSESTEDSSIRPFKIHVADEVLQDLKSRLDKTRYEDPVEDSKFLYGFNPNYLRKVVDYWRKEYDWRTQEEMLNQFPHFKTSIEGLDIHFLHVKPKLPEGSNLKVLPLMIIHGWPGSVVEFYKIIPMMTTPRAGQDFVFEVICPSIPGFGFSESPHRKGFNARAAARIFVTLMERIGLRRFYVQGGDWGSAIAQLMTRYYSPRILGLHVNMYFGNLRLWEKVKFLTVNFLPFLVSKEEYRICFPITRMLKMSYLEGAYFHMQSTKPDTLGETLLKLADLYLLTGITIKPLPNSGVASLMTYDITRGVPKHPPLRPEVYCTVPSTWICLAGRDFELKVSSIYVFVWTGKTEKHTTGTPYRSRGPNQEPSS